MESLWAHAIGVHFVRIRAWCAIYALGKSQSYTAGAVCSFLNNARMRGGALLQYSSFLPSFPSLHPFCVLLTEIPGA